MSAKYVLELTGSVIVWFFMLAIEVWITMKVLEYVALVIGLFGFWYWFFCIFGTVWLFNLTGIIKDKMEGLTDIIEQYQKE